MKLPNGDKAVIDERKLWGYVLNPRHPKGESHAFLFDRLLGINLSNWTILRDELLRAACEGDARVGKPSEHGKKFEIRFSMAGPRGTYTVVSVWFIPKGEDDPRLITSYVE